VPWPSLVSAYSSIQMKFGIGGRMNAVMKFYLAHTGKCARRSQAGIVIILSPLLFT